jgi:hypothetical protein
MTQQQKTIRAAEELVRKVFEHDLRQNVSQAVIREVALKVSKVVPQPATKRGAQP